MAVAVKEWIRNIAVFFILLTTVMNLLPQNHYKKYVRFFLGLVLIVWMIHPVLGLFGLEDKMSSRYQFYQFQESWNEAKGDAEDVSGKRLDYLKKMYEEEIKRDIGAIAEKNELYVSQVKVYFTAEEETIRVSRIDLVAAYTRAEAQAILVPRIAAKEEGESRRVRNTKKTIQDFYNIEEEHININIQR